MRLAIVASLAVASHAWALGLRPPLRVRPGPRLWATTTSVQPDPTPSATPGPMSREDMLAQWWPIGSTTHLDEDVPNAVKLMDKDFVVWKSKEGTWSMAEDVCPHKLAALSEGSIDDNGALRCSYHYWAFNSEGRCTSVPQRLDDAVPIPKRCDLKSYKTHRTGEVLWAWMHRGSEPTYLPEDLEPALVNCSMTYARIAPYRWDFFLENVLDPSHVAAAHHSVGGDREDAGPYDVLDRNVSLADNEMVHRVNMTVVRAGRSITDWRFKFPAFWSISNNFMGLYIVATPVDEDRTLIVRFNNAYITSLFKKNPLWPLMHLRYNRFFDSDALLVQQQQQNSLSVDPWDPARSYAQPSDADAMPMAFRKWFNVRLGGVVPSLLDPEEKRKSVLAARAAGAPERAVVFDSWEQHGKFCRTCRAIERLARHVRVVAAGAAALVGVVLGPLLLPAPASAAVTLALAGVALAAHRLQQSFHLKDFRHGRLPALNKSQRKLTMQRQPKPAT